MHLVDAHASGSGVNSPSAGDCSSRFALCELLHLCDALSGQTLTDGRDCRTREAGDHRHQTTEYKRENAPVIGETIAHFATHTSPARHGLRMVHEGDAEMPLIRLEHVFHNHSMVAAQLISGGLALPRHYLPVGYPPFYEYKRVHQIDVIAPPNVLPRRSETQE